MVSHSRFFELFHIKQQGAAQLHVANRKAELSDYGVTFEICAMEEILIYIRQIAMQKARWLDI